MGQLDTSIPMQVKTANLADLADMYFGARKYKEDMLSSKQERALRDKQATYQENADKRSGSAETRAQAEYDQALIDLATKRKDARHSKYISMMGEEAEAMDALTPEKRAEYYSKHLLPAMQKEGFDTSVMPEYSDALIQGWRQKAMTPGERSAERNTKVKAAGYDMYDLKIDKDGNYVYIPKTPPVTLLPGQNANGVINSQVTAPPQVGVVQGAEGPMGYSFPRGSNAQPTAVPISNPQAGGAPVERPRVDIPAPVKMALRQNAVQGASISRILTQLATTKADPTGLGKALLSKVPYGGEKAVKAVDPKSNELRIALSNLGDIEVFDITGKASSAKELERYKKWIPDLDNDDLDRVKYKLANFTRQLESENSTIQEQFGTKRYNEDPLMNRQPVAPPRPVVPYKYSGKTSDGKDFTIEEIP